MLAAAAGEPPLPFGGAYQLQYAPDVAAAFVAAARGPDGAELRIGGAVRASEEVIAAITRRRRARRSTTTRRAAVPATRAAA